MKDIECKYTKYHEDCKCQRKDKDISDINIKRNEYCRRYNYFNRYVAPGYNKTYNKIQTEYIVTKGKILKILEEIPKDDEEKINLYRTYLQNNENIYPDKLEKMVEDIKNKYGDIIEFDREYNHDKMCVNDTFVHYMVKRFVFRLKSNEYINQLKNKEIVLERFIKNGKRFELFCKLIQDRKKVIERFEVNVKAENKFYDEK